MLGGVTGRGDVRNPRDPPNQLKFSEGVYSPHAPVGLPYNGVAPPLHRRQRGAHPTPSYGWADGKLPTKEKVNNCF